jgi:hypothetical protein
MHRRTSNNEMLDIYVAAIDLKYMPPAVAASGCPRPLDYTLFLDFLGFCVLAVKPRSFGDLWRSYTEQPGWIEIGVLVAILIMVIVFVFLKKNPLIRPRIASWILEPFREVAGAVPKNWIFWIWFASLIVSAIVPAVVVILFQFFKDKFWLIWELSGVASTVILALAMFRVWTRGTTRQTPLGNLLTPRGSGSLFLLLFMGFLCLCIAGVFSFLEIITNWNHTSIGTTFFLVLASFYYAKSQIQIIRSPQHSLSPAHKAQYQKLKAEAISTVRLSDVPTFITFIVLFIFTSVATWRDVDEYLLKSFVGGAISFQLLLSNIIFGFNYVVGRRHR